MRMTRLLALMVGTIAFAALPALADDGTSGKPAVTGKDNAVQRIEAAAARQMEVLTGLLSKVPEQAQPAIEKAIAAASDGHDRAIAALTGHGGPGEVTGLERARAAVAAGFEKGTTALQDLLDEVPSRAVSRIEAALNRLDDARAVALRNLDSLIAGERPDHPGAPDRPERPEHPSRPDRPERPERPQAPDRPERPQVPDHPSPPQG